MKQVNGTNNRVLRQGEAGLSLLESMVAMVLLSIGLMAVAGAIGYSVTSSYRSKNAMESKEIILSTLEQIENLRNTRRLEFGQVANAGSVDNNGASVPFTGFSTGFQPVATEPGTDGIFGTADDPVTNTQGAAEVVRKGLYRKVEITSLNSFLKKVKVTVRSQGGNGALMELDGFAYLNDNARATFSN